MKTLRTPSALVALFLLSASLALPLHAQTITWTGSSPVNGDAVDGRNWGGATVLGNGTESALFGDISGNAMQTVLIPNPAELTAISQSTVGLIDLTFSGQSTPYTITSSNYSTASTAYLNLSGNVSVAAGNTVDLVIDNSMVVGLSSGPHTVSVGSGSILTVNAWVSGSASLSKSGTGTLILSGPNTINGGVTVDAGTLLIGSSSGTYSVWNGESYSNYPNGPVGTGTLTLNNGSTLGVISDSSQWLSNNIALTGTSSAVTLDTGSGGELDLGGVISGPSAINVTGTGTLWLESSNTFSGGLTVNSGAVVNLDTDSTIDLESHAILSSPVGTGTVTLNGGSEMNATDGAVHLANNIVLAGTSSGGTDNYAHIEEESSDMNLSGLITGAGGLDWCTSYTLTLTNAANTFAGGVDMREGTLLLGASSTGPAGSPTAGPIGTGGLILYGGSTLGVAPSAGSITLHNNISVSSDAEFPVYLDSSNGNLTLAGVISGAGVLRTSGAGAVTLTGTNTFTGDLYAGSQALNLSDNAASQAVLGLGFNSTVNFTGTSPLIAGLEASAAGDTVNLMPGSTLTINQTEDTVFGGQIVAGGAGVNVTKQGTGTLTLSNANTYSGTTTISAGTLYANHGNGESGAIDALGTSTIVINGGKLKIAAGYQLTNPLTLTAGTLAGNYTFTTSQTFGAGITLSPGNSPGTMSFTNLTLTGGNAPIDIKAAIDDPGTSTDFFTGTGTLDLSGVGTHGYTLQLISLMPDNSPGAVSGLSGATSWTLYQFNTITGFVADSSQFIFDTSQFVNNGLFSLSLTGLAGDGQNLMLNFTPVPEPSTYALMALGLVGTGLAACRKRRRTT